MQAGSDLGCPRPGKRVAAIASVVALVAVACDVANQGHGAQPPTAVATQPTAIVTVADPRADDGTSLDYLDIRSAAVSEDAHGWLVFSMTTAGRIPNTSQPAAWDAVLWSFCIDTDPATTPIGYPFAPTTGAPCEFILGGMSTDGVFAQVFIDRRPLLDGDEPSTEPMSMRIGPRLIEVRLPARLLGSPDTFRWVAFTTELTLPMGNDQFVNLDQVPDAGLDAPARWPAAR